MHLMRCPEVMKRALSTKLSSAEFPPKMTKYRVIYEVLEAYVSEHNALPTYDTLSLEVLKVAESVDDCDERFLYEVNMLLWHAFWYGDPPAPKGLDQFNPDYILSRDGPLQVLVNEVKLSPLRAAVSHMNDPIEVAQVFLDAQQTVKNTRVTATGGVFMKLSSETRAELLEVPPPVLTGVELIDVTVGGLAPASMVGVLAESSGGKTMFGIQYTVEQAFAGRKTALFSYEQQLEGDIASRLYSYAASIGREEFKQAQEHKTAHGHYPDDIAQALQVAEDRLSENLFLFDMSGKIEDQGYGGVEEIEQYLAALEADGIKIEVLVIDWLGVMVKQAYKMGADWMKKIDNLAQKVQFELGELKAVNSRYGLTTMVLHQIAPGVIESKSPSFKPDWTTAHECKSFGHLMHYVFTFGRKDRKTNCMWFCVPKARGVPQKEVISRMDGEYNQILYAKDYDPNALGNDQEGWFVQSSAQSTASDGSQSALLRSL